MYDILILGAGAAGLYSAMLLGQAGLRVAVADHCPLPGQKLALAGGGMGNVTNRNISCEDYVGENPEFCRSALKNYGPDKVLSLLTSLNIPYEEREYGQIFCLKKAQFLVDQLFLKAQNTNVNFYLGQTIRLKKENSGFSLNFQNASPIKAPKLLLATGSPAWPSCGATGQGALWAKQWGHSLHEFRPILVPFILSMQNPALLSLAGICLDVGIHLNGKKIIRPLLFTHGGVSGPAVLLLSCYWQQKTALSIDFLPKVLLKDLLHAPENGKLLLKNLLCRHMPERLALALCPEDLSRRKVAELSRQHRELLAKAFHSAQLFPDKTAGFKKAEAAAGGINVAEINPKTMRSLLVPGLFFAGEIMDVAGHLGGYNLHWAFASAYAFTNCAMAEPRL